MTYAMIDAAGSMPSDSQFHSESCHALEVCQQHCHCPDHWHFIWAGMKAAGLRRGIYLQQALFDQLLANRKQLRQQVLIAGSADAGALHVLHHALGNPGVSYHAIDRCQSPLQLLSEYAQAQDIRLTTGISDIQSSPPGPWDIILLHNTLVFLPEPARIETLRRLSESLSPDGTILCGMRYSIAPPDPDTATQARECDKTRTVIAQTFAGQPEIVELLHPMIEPYVQAQMTSLSHRACRSQFHSELARAGLRIVESCPDRQVLPSVTSELNAALQIEAELLLLQRA